MRAAIVRMVPMGKTPWGTQWQRPELPDSVAERSQGFNEIKELPGGLVKVFLVGETDDELLAIASQPLAFVGDRVADQGVGSAMAQALRTADPRYRDAVAPLWAARKEKSAATPQGRTDLHDLACRIGDVEREMIDRRFAVVKADWLGSMRDADHSLPDPQDGGGGVDDAKAVAAAVVRLMLLGAPLGALLKLLAGRQDVFALTAISGAADNFNRADADPMTTTMSGGDTWTNDTSTFKTVSSKGQPSSAATVTVIRDGTMTSVAVARTSVVISGTLLFIQPSVRASSGSALCHFTPNAAKTQLYKIVAGTETQVGSDGTAGVAGDTFSADIDAADAFQGLVNGAVVCGPSTPTSINSTGKCGMRAFQSGTAAADDWIAYGADPVASGSWFVLGPTM